MPNIELLEKSMRFLRFIVPDLIEYRPANIKQLVKEILDIMEDYHMVGGRGMVNRVLRKITG